MAALDGEIAARADYGAGGGDSITPVDRRDKRGRRIAEIVVDETRDIGVARKRRTLDCGNEINLSGKIGHDLPPILLCNGWACAIVLLLCDYKSTIRVKIGSRAFSVDAKSS